MGIRSAASGLILGLATVLAPAAHAGCEPGTLEIRNAAGTVSRFRVEIADTGAERGQGLMFRDRVARSAGMLFVYEAPQRATFWMKNTLIPLDMIFADTSGTVTRVHAEAVPGDLALIDGGEGVRFVLEINGGLAAPLGIGEGAVMRSDLIPQDAAAWRCDGQ